MGKARLRHALHIGGAILIAVLAIGLYRAKSDAAKTQAHVRALQNQIEAGEADLRALRAEIAHLESPGRIEDLAESHLGLSVGGESPALPESAIDDRLPAPRSAKAGE